MNEMKINSKSPQETIVAVNDEVEEIEGGKNDYNPDVDTIESSILGSGMTDEEITYDEFNLPEGIDVDKNILAIATEQFRALGLNQKQAQGIVDLSPQITETIRNAQQKEWDLTTSKWARDIRNDAEIGGRNFKKSVAKAEKALSLFDRGGKLKEFLVTTKAGNNPDMIRFLVSVADAFSESSIRKMPESGAGQELSDAELFFPELAKRDALTRKMMNSK